MFEKLKERYQKYYIRDDQLERYVALGVITEEQADEIMGLVKITGGGRPEQYLTLSIPGSLYLQVPLSGGAAHGDH